MTKIVDLFIQLVKIDSPSGEESNVAVFLTNWLKKRNFVVKQDKVGSLYAYRPGVGTPILFSAHMDTVEPGRNIKPQIQDGFIKSDGTTILGADNKVSMAAILTAVDEYIQENISPRSLELLFSIKEETGNGIEYFPFKWVKSKTGFIFDSTEKLGGIILSSPYIYNFYIDFIGVSSHAARPQEGKNSLLAFNDFLNHIQVGKVDNGKTTINIGKVVSGTGINTVPGLTEVKGEIRSIDQKLFNNHLANTKKTAKISGKKYKEIVNWKTDGYCPGYLLSPKDPNIKKLSGIIKKFGLIPSFIHSQGVSDSNIFINAGLKVFNLTDGCLNPHTTQETVSIETLEQLTKLIKTLLSQF